MASLPSSSAGGRAERGLHIALINAAAAADDHAVSALLPLATDTDLNAADDAGCTVLGAAIAGNSWKDADASDASFRLDKRLAIVKMLLDHGGLSLYSLNAPQDAMQGVTPLGLAAWLNIPDVVVLLLEECPGMVTVDGVDSRGATPLMYAARDGNVEVVQRLLAHGARPEYRDIHHRTAIHHALRHPQVLWLCESSLRWRRRSCETITKTTAKQLCPSDESLTTARTMTSAPCYNPLPPAEELLTRTLTLASAVLSQDIHELNYLLFSADPALSSSSASSSLPFLINYPDEQGWSPIHHCVSATNPSSTVLDILYRAGADKASAMTSPSIRSFIHHLVDDLRAPLSALDHEGETCIHIAAEHGDNIDVLAALLDCDTTGVVRNLRNSRGLTALEVAQPRFKVAFGVSTQPVLTRAGSSASVRTIKPSTSSVESSAPLSVSQLRTTHAPDNAHDETSPLFILDNLDWLSQELADTGGNLDVRAAGDLLQETSNMGERYLSGIRNRLQDVAAEIESARLTYQRMAAALEDARRVETGLGEGSPVIGREGDHEDFARLTLNTVSSESTMVSSGTDAGSIVFVSKEVTMVDVAVSAVPIPLLSVEIHGEDEDPLANTSAVTTPPTPSRPDPIHHLLRPVKSLTDIRHHNMSTGEERGLLGIVSPWVKGLPRKRSKSDLTSNRTSPRCAAQTSFEDSLKSRTARLRAWFKRKLMPDVNAKTVIVMALDEESCPVGREVKSLHTLANVGSQAASAALPAQKSHQGVVRALARANRDLATIHECISSAERCASLTSRSAGQAGQLLQTIVQEHQKSLEAARFIQEHLVADSEMITLPDVTHSLSRKNSLEFPPVTIPTSPRNSQLVFPRPPAPSSPSLISFSSTLIESDDEDLRQLRQLLTRKIQARLDGAYDRAEKAVIWLRIVRDVTRTARRLSAER